MKSPEVDAWFDKYENPMKEVLLFVRDAVLESDERIEECIKWQSPTFTYKGNIASFNPRSKKHASLMFHNGADIPGNFPHLEGDGKAGRSVKISDVPTAEGLKDEIVSMFKAWCDMKDA
jgi:hypothetical protein